jgi:hypothetical protein
MPLTDHTQQLRQRIAAHRASVSARRARAYVDCPDYVLGCACRPLTPPTWTMLHATGNRLATGGVPLEGDLRNYLWFHSRLFLLAAWLPALLARALKWLALLPFSVTLHRRRDPDWYAATLALAGAEIRAIIAEALADAPAGDGRDCAPGPCLQAQFEHFCAERYGWAPAFTSRQPLRRLFQLRRCLDAATDDDPEERAIRYAHLRERNASALAARQPA